MLFSISLLTWKLLKCISLFSFPFQSPLLHDGLNCHSGWLTAMTCYNNQLWTLLCNFQVPSSLSSSTKQIRGGIEIFWNYPDLLLTFLTPTILVSPTVTFISGASSDWLAIPDKAISSFGYLSFPPVSVHQNIFLVSVSVDFYCSWQYLRTWSMISSARITCWPPCGLEEPLAHWVLISRCYEVSRDLVQHRQQTNLWIQWGLSVKVYVPITRHHQSTNLCRRYAPGAIDEQ